jgi:predicted Zn-dependent peptidase
VFVGTVDQGIGVYVYPTDRFKTITLYAAWITDLRAETAALTALVPYCLRRGTVRWPTFSAMEGRLDDLYGASFRADVGKLGDKQLLSFRLEVVDGRYLPGHPDTLAQALDFLAEVMQRPALHGGLFPDDVVNQEKEMLRRQIESLLNDKAQFATQRCLETMAQGRPFGIRRYGRARDLESIDSERVTAWWQAGQAQWPLVVFAVGGVDPARVAELVHNAWPGRSNAAWGRVEPFHPRSEPHTVVERQEVQQGKLVLGFGTRTRLVDPMYPAMVMYAGILGGFPHSKLFVNVREKASLAYYAYARLDGMLGLMLVGAGIEFAHYDAALDIIRRQVDDLARGVISDDEMDLTLRGLVNELHSEADSPSALIGRELELRVLGGGPTSDELEAALSRVTRAEVQEAARAVTLDTVYFLTTRREATADA